MRKLVLSMSLMTAMFFVSCEQDSVNDEVYNDTSSYQSKSTSTTAVDCENSVSDNAVVYKDLTGSSGDYCVWNKVTKTIGTVSVQFEGMYGGSIRPLTSGWYIGVVDPAYDCTYEWDDIAEEVIVKNVPANVGTDPSCGSFIPENVVGAHGIVSPYDFGLGYYEYQQPGGLTITKKVVIWKDASATSATAVTNPLSAVEAYLIEVTSIVPTFSAPPFYGTVSYTYTKVL